MPVKVTFGSASNCCKITSASSQLCSLVQRPSLSLSSAITILEAGKKELVKREEGLVKLVT